jgi:hypothetical protein
MGRNAMRAIENTALEEFAINKAASVGADVGNAIAGSGHPHGVIGVAHGLVAGGGGSVSVALHATPAILAAPVIRYGMNRINRYNRLRGVLSGQEALKQRATDAFQEAKETREFFLDTAEEKVLNMNGYRRDAVVREWNAEKANLKKHTSDFESMYPQYLDKLKSVSSSSGNVAKKFAGNFTSGEIGVTPLATGLKLANAAEMFAIVKILERAEEAGKSGTSSSVYNRPIPSLSNHAKTYTEPTQSYADPVPSSGYDSLRFPMFERDRSEASERTMETVEGINQDEKSSISAINQYEKRSMSTINQDEKSNISAINQDEKRSISAINQDVNRGMITQNQATRRRGEVINQATRRP